MLMTYKWETLINFQKGALVMAFSKKLIAKLALILIGR